MPIQSLINVLLLTYLASFPLLLYLNKEVVKGKNKNLNKALKTGRKIHPYVGIVLVISGLIHGYTKLGGQFMFHTGSLLLMALMANGFLGFYYKKKHNRKIATVHRALGFLIIALFLLHYLKPWFFGY